MPSMNQINPGRRPSIAEIRDYYSRDEILNELLQAMQRWHVRFVPGYAKSLWVYTENRQELHSMIMKRLGLMGKRPERPANFTSIDKIYRAGTMGISSGWSAKAEFRN